MTRLARYDPFTLTRMDAFEDWVRGFVPATLRSGLRTLSEPTIAIEVQELDKAYMVSAELPGVKKEDIDISIAGNQVTSSAEYRHEKVTDAAKEWCNERRSGKVTRSFMLPLEIDEKGADASYIDGVLHLTLPKKASSMVKKLTRH